MSPHDRSDPSAAPARHTSTAELDAALDTAVAAFAALSSLGRSGRARLLRAVSTALEADRDDLVTTCGQETGLPTSRLHQELSRARFQFEHFADVLDDGAYLEATVDHRGDSPAGPRPDLRRMLLPLGPVGVFGASNFPFAFSVAGGDTASALAAGCPVVAKVHEAHPLTSASSFRAIRRAAESIDVDTGILSLVHGQQAGTELVRHPAVRAVGFTGSLPVGRLLADIAAARPDPIPFYGELGALNVVAVCPAAARARGVDIARGLAGSFTLGVGQYCTKPGLVLIPAGPDGRALREALITAVGEVPSGVMLSERIAGAYATRSTALAGHTGVTVLAGDSDAHPVDAGGRHGAPLLLEVDPDQLTGDLLEECFGPILLVATYTDVDQLRSIVSRTGPALTGTIHADGGDLEVSRGVLEILAGRVGRVVWNAFPTGLAVAWATHHGGPYPASTAVLHTSVGATAIRRWLRPICFQDVPADLLPDELRDEPADRTLLRRVDGSLRIAG